jgi:uncharacterized protein YodC (DUF2158 family)
MFKSAEFDPSELISMGKAEWFRVPGDLPFRIGTRVRLNSGSPEMLVVDREDNGDVTCTWNNKSGAEEEITGPEVCFHLADFIPTSPSGCVL